MFHTHDDLLERLFDSDAATLARLGSLGPPHNLLSAQHEELVACGLTPRELARLDACRELLRSSLDRPSTPPFSAPEAFARAVRDLAFRLREELWVVTVDSELRPLTCRVAAIGTAHSCPVEPSQIFSLVLRAHAQRFFVAHNHPSGNTEASPDDLALTLQVQEGARLLGLEMLDHLIVTRHGWRSCLSQASGTFPTPTMSRLEAPLAHDRPARRVPAPERQAHLALPNTSRKAMKINHFSSLAGPRPAVPASTVSAGHPTGGDFIPSRALARSGLTARS